MKRFIPFFFGAILLAGSMVYQRLSPPPNPDPNHTHADFAVFIDGEQLDLSAAKYMSGLSGDDATHDEEGEYLHQYLHLHDGNGNVMHRHKSGLTVADFLQSIGFTLEEKTCDASGSVCSQLLSHPDFDFAPADVYLYVNGATEPGIEALAYEFSDLDRILITTASEPENVAAEWESVTDDACLYSRTCPWRGAAPTENCIADPSIPCVLPE